MAEIKNFPNNSDEYIGAENVMRWLHGRTSGVFGADGNLSVSPAGGMSVKITDGIGWLADSEANGTVFWNETKKETGSDMILEIPLSNAVFPRIDRVVVSWETTDYAARPNIEVLSGSPSSSPAAPSLTNNAIKREISLAKVYVSAAANEIKSENITDERLNSEVCGLVTDWVGVDTSVMQSQFTAFLQAIKTELEQLNGGTATMLKAQYDPDDAGVTFSDLATAQKNISKNSSDISNANAQISGLNAGLELAKSQISGINKDIGFVIAKLEVANWSGAAPYTQTVTIPGMTEDWIPGVPTYIPITNSDGSINVSESETTLEEVAYVRFAVSKKDQLTFICPENRPTRGMWLRVPGMQESGKISYAGSNIADDKKAVLAVLEKAAYGSTEASAAYSTLAALWGVSASETKPLINLLQLDDAPDGNNKYIVSHNKESIGTASGGTIEVTDDGDGNVSVGN